MKFVRCDWCDGMVIGQDYFNVIITLNGEMGGLPEEQVCPTCIAERDSKKQAKVVSPQKFA